MENDLLLSMNDHDDEGTAGIWYRNNKGVFSRVSESREGKQTALGNDKNTDSFSRNKEHRVSRWQIVCE